MENPLHPVSCKYRPLGNICVLHFQVVIRVHKETRAFLSTNTLSNYCTAKHIYIYIPIHTHYLIYSLCEYLNGLRNTYLMYQILFGI